MFYSVGANRGQLLYMYILRGREGGDRIDDSRMSTLARVRVIPGRMLPVVRIMSKKINDIPTILGRSSDVEVRNVTSVKSALAKKCCLFVACVQGPF